MNIAQLLSTGMPAAASVGAAIISVLAAISTAVLAHLFNRSLEAQKAKYRDLLAQRKHELQLELDKRKADFENELENLKAEKSDELATKNARRTYEYDARKSLYVHVEPLLFQLFEAAEGARVSCGNQPRPLPAGGKPTEAAGG